MTLRDDMLARREAARKRGQSNRHERRRRKALGEVRADPKDEPAPADADRYWMLRLVHPSHRSFRLESPND